MGLTKPRAYQIYDIDYKQSVRVITLTNITLSGGAPSQVDNVNLSLNDRVLVAGQSNAAQNGLYYVTTVGSGSNGTWARSTDGNQTGEIESGMIVMVTEGTIWADTSWKLVTNDPITIGVSELVFEQNTGDAFGDINANGTSVTANTASSTLNLAAGDNILISGNNTSKTVTIGVTGISLNSISNGTSNVNVVSSGGNVTVGVGGTSNIAVFSTTGANITGTLEVSGNITGGNLNTAGQVVATGNIDTVGAVNINSSSGMYNVLNITGTALAPYGSSQTWKFFTQNAVPGGPGSWILFPDSSTQTTAYPGSSSTLSLSGNITGGNLIANSAVVATGNITGGNITTAGLINATGNITGGNLSGTSITGTLLTAAQTNITSVGTLGSLTVTANVAGGNLTTAGQVVATGNVNTSGAFVGAGTGLTGTASSLTVGAATTAGTVTTAAQPNITSVGTLSSLAVTANVAGGNLTTVGQISATGTITTAAGNNSTGFAVGNGAVSNVGLGFFPTAGTRGDYAIRDYSSVFSTMYLDVGIGGSAGGEFQFRTGNTYSLSMRANSSGVYSSGVMSATGTVSGSELSSTNSQTNEGGQINLALPSSGSTLVDGVIIDIYQNNLRFFERGGTNRGAYIDLTAASAGVGTNLLAGSGGGNVAGSNTQVQFNDGGAFGANGQFTYNKVTNTLTVGIVAANNNGTGQNFKVGDDIWIGDINLADTMRLTGQQNGANAYIVFGNSDGAQLGRAGTGPLTYAGAFSATGNVTGGNLTTAGQVTAVGNISGNYFIGNGSQLTGIATGTPNAIVNGTSNVSISSSGGNVTVGVGGSSNAVVFSAGVLAVNGLITTPKTISISGTLPANTNSQLLSPATIADGVTITVPDSSTLYITP